MLLPPRDVVTRGDLHQAGLPVIGFPSTTKHIGPLNTRKFALLPLDNHEHGDCFTAKILQTCQTLYSEGFPILHGLNSFNILWLNREGFAGCVTGRSFAPIRSLRRQCYRLH
jgi:hypothetical protein